MGHYGSARIALFCSAGATLRRTIADFVAHYHGERNYRGIDNELIQPLRQADAEGTVRRRQRMSGMLNYYYCAAQGVSGHLDGVVGQYAIGNMRAVSRLA